MHETGANLHLHRACSCLAGASVSGLLGSALVMGLIIVFGFGIRIFKKITN